MTKPNEPKPMTSPAPESSTPQQKRYEEIGRYLDFSSTRTTDPAGSNLWKHCSWLLDRIRELDRPQPAPAPCSEVVERLRNEAYHRSVIDDPCHVMPGNISYAPSRFDSAQATAILHEWREHLVQELENLLAKHSGCSHCNDSASGGIDK